MTEQPPLVPAWCAGRAVEVAVKPSPPDHRRVNCPTCGAQRGAECRQIGNPGRLHYDGHESRRRRAEKLYGGENP